MQSRKAPRYQGKITAWKDDQGFGFIAPNGGGPAVFVHISAFASRAIRPADDDIVTYRLGAGDRGPRAEQVAFVGARTRRQATSGARTGALLAAAGFLGFVAACVLAGKLAPAWLAGYLGASALAFLVYATDKSAARNDTRRTPEQTLHLLGLLGGWPGALVAQQVLRHKSKKEAFRTVFRATVVVNCGALAVFLMQ